ncbi:hypothetical protein CEQ90_05255 [Lewinellaceae bacterium SD302]|nr:hypothetical protein CEQ90_05255 [Lewinellaceae bacterium SD302]
MSIWDRLFGENSRNSQDDEPDYRFGRYSDAYKTAANYRAWDEALAAFEIENYQPAFVAFLNYLRDEEEDNVRYQIEGEKLYFEFYQGSKRITGFADEEQFRAQARIARLGAVPAELFQRLTAENYELKYGRYAIDEERCLCLVFDSRLSDASPHKLYTALKEIALKADKKDDLLISEFKELLPVEINHLQQLTPEEKQAKHGFLTTKIDETLTYLSSNHLNPEEHPGAIAYLLLDLIYKLDYLLIPEGQTMEALERMHRMYFAHEKNQPVTYKNVRLIGELQELRQRAADSFAAELYAGKSTFGLTLPVTHDRVANNIRRDLHNMDWYQNNGFPKVALALPGYIVGYSLFNYATPPPARDLFHLYYRIREDAYFRQLGYQQAYLGTDGRPHRRSIRSAISAIGEKHRKQYPRLRPVLGNLDFDNLTNFSRTYLEMVVELDLSRV